VGQSNDGQINDRFLLGSGEVRLVIALLLFDHKGNVVWRKGVLGWLLRLRRRDFHDPAKNLIGRNAGRGEMLECRYGYVVKRFQGKQTVRRLRFKISNN
jgi:hypothetical protein